MANAGIAIGKAGVEAIEREGAATVILDEAKIELPELLTDTQDRAQLTVARFTVFLLEADDWRISNAIRSSLSKWQPKRLSAANGWPLWIASCITGSGKRRRAPSHGYRTGLSVIKPSLRQDNTEIGIWRWESRCSC
jgi:hypothetical protein